MPPLPAAGVPLSTPVPGAGPGMKLTPLGSVSVLLSISVGAGVPVAVTVKVPGVPTVKVVLAALVMARGVASLVPWMSSGNGAKAVSFVVPNVIKLVPVTLPMM